jgi:hypothetical protein
MYEQYGTNNEVSKSDTDLSRSDSDLSQSDIELSLSIHSQDGSSDEADVKSNRRRTALKTVGDQS